MDARIFHGTVTEAHMMKILRHFKLKRNRAFYIVVEERDSMFYMEIFKPSESAT